MLRTHSGARALAKLLHGHSVLESLDLCDNQLRGAGAKALGATLQGNTRLRTLNFRLNRIGDKGGKAFFEAIRGNSALQVWAACRTRPRLRVRVHGEVLIARRDGGK